jgi:hypothetical protein
MIRIRKHDGHWWVRHENCTQPHTLPDSVNGMNLWENALELARIHLVIAHAHEVR